MKKNSKFIDRIFAEEAQDPNKKYKKLGLQFNPFPKSGTANINGSDIYNQKLIPVDEKVTTQLLDFIRDALVVNKVDNNDRFISATITGDYGSGKTQLLLFVRALLGEVAARHKAQRNPYVIYIDNPGVKLLEFIGSIISRVGEENFKKFIWAKIVDEIKYSEEHRNRLKPFQASGGVLFQNTNPDPYAEENTVSYKLFLNSFTQYIANTRYRKEFDETLRDILIKILGKEIGDSVLAQYFYELISEDYGVNKTWEALSTGSIRQLDRKVVEIIRYIVRLIKEQGYTDFFILVDEFEDVTRGRLSKTQVDNYVYNLRTLLDEHREWCLLFSMTGEALRKLRSVSPPLAERISARQINLQSLNAQQAKRITNNYLNIAREKDLDDLKPFDSTGIEKLNEMAEGNARRFLRGCYLMIERASSGPVNKQSIDSDFIIRHFPLISE